MKSVEKKNPATSPVTWLYSISTERKKNMVWGFFNCPHVETEWPWFGRWTRSQPRLLLSSHGVCVCAVPEVFLCLLTEPSQSRHGHRVRQVAKETLSLTSVHHPLQVFLSWPSLYFIVALYNRHKKKTAFLRRAQIFPHPPSREWVMSKVVPAVVLWWHSNHFPTLSVVVTRVQHVRCISVNRRTRLRLCPITYYGQFHHLQNQWGRMIARRPTSW